MNPKVRLYDFNVYDKNNKDSNDLIDSDDEEENKDFGNKKQFMIQMFAMDKVGNDYSILIDNYNPYSLILLYTPPFVYNVTAIFLIEHFLYYQ